MYKIIGADGKEYGPITLDQVRQWMAEGRANLQTRILPDGASQWVTIADLPDLSGSPPPLSPGAPSFAGLPSPGAPVVAGAVEGPATGLICVAILGFLAQACSLVWRFTMGAAFYANQANNPFAGLGSPVLTIATAVVGILVSFLILFGALKMKRLENHGFAMTVSILAMIPCVSPCCIIGLPVGIWALVALLKPEVKAAFR